MMTLFSFWVLFPIPTCSGPSVASDGCSMCGFRCTVDKGWGWQVIRGRRAVTVHSTLVDDCGSRNFLSRELIDLVDRPSFCL